MFKQTSFVLNIIGGVLAGILGTMIVLRFPASFSVTLPAQHTALQDGIATQLPPTSNSSHEKVTIDTVERSQPAVVSIVITKDVPIIERFYGDVPGNFFGPFGDFFNDPFSQFQFRVPQLRERGTEKQEIGGGSGFLISPDGMIVTNRHVVSEEGAEYTVFLNDGTKHEAKVFAQDPVIDIAIIKIEGAGFPSLSFGDSDHLRVGQTVIAIGNALGEFRNTVSSGVISGLSRSISAGDERGQTEQLDEVIQTDAAINRGNSGGPLLDLSGNVVGVNVAVAFGSENIGFALPANTVKAIVESVQKEGKIVRPYLGIRYVQITPALQKANNLPIDHGVLVLRGEKPEELAVIPGSPANKAGIVEGDIITEIDGERIDEKTSLAALIRKKKVADTINLKVYSKSQEQEVRVTLEAFPS